MLHGDMYAYTARQAIEVSWKRSLLSDGFVRPDWLSGPSPQDWIPIELEIRTQPDERLVYFGIGSYYEHGSMDFDDAFMGLARTALTIHVSGQSLRNVVVMDQAGHVCWASGNLSAGTTEVRHTIPELSTAGRYEVRATTADGKEVSQWYPQKQ
jgi:hypothetical protein